MEDLVFYLPPGDLAAALVIARTRLCIEKCTRSFRILDLPPELVEIIAMELNNSDLLNIRKVCRALRRYSTAAFGPRFFENLIAFRHPTSLSILQDVSQHPELYKYVREITIMGAFQASSNITALRPSFSVLESMSQSEMDIDILAKIFIALKGLRTVEVVNFHCIDIFKRAMKCGRKSIQNEVGSTLGSEVTIQEGILRVNRVYKSVIKALQMAGKGCGAALHMDYIKMGRIVEPFLLDLQSDDWTNLISSRLEQLSIWGPAHPAWGSGLVRSTPNLRKVKLFDFDETMYLTRDSAEILHWPNLHTLDLRESSAVENHFVSFLNSQGRTLEYLNLYQIDLLHGTWTEPVRTIKAMPKLQKVCLGRLSATDSHRYGHEHFAQYSKTIYVAIKLASMPRISNVLAALLSDVRTIAFDDGKRVQHIVDFRKASAAAEGRIVLHNGVWEFRNKVKELSAHTGEPK